MEISEWLPRLHVLIIGPGLGRDPLLLANVQVSLHNIYRNLHSSGKSLTYKLPLSDQDVTLICYLLH